MRSAQPTNMGGGTADGRGTSTPPRPAGDARGFGCAELCGILGGARRQIVFLHIAKTAGTSISRYLALAMPGARTLHRDAEEFDRLDRASLEPYDVIQGHISFVHLAKLRDDRFVFTFLRDPVDRVLSVYHFFRSRRHPLDDVNPSSPFVLAKQLDLLSFLRLANPAVQVLVANHQTYALGLDWRTRSRDHDAAVLRRAKRVLSQLDFVGLTERFGESTGMLFSELGISDLPPEIWENATRERPSTSSLTREESKAIEDLNALDIALYRHAKRLYIKRRIHQALRDAPAKARAAVKSWRSHRDADQVLAHQERFDGIMSRLWVGNPYDVARVTPLPYDAQEDWGRDNHVIRSIVERVRPRTIIEVGVWKGCSAIAMCDALKVSGQEAVIIAVDTWGGLSAWLDWVREIRTDRGIPIVATWWAEHQRMNLQPLTWPGEFGHFEQFASNVVSRRMDQNIVPMPMDGRLAVEWFRDQGIVPDLVHLDATHDFDENLDLMDRYWSLIGPGGVMMGTDYHPSHIGLVKAVHAFAHAKDLFVTFRGNTWVVCK